MDDSLLLSSLSNLLTANGVIMWNQLLIYYDKLLIVFPSLCFLNDLHCAFKMMDVDDFL